MSTAAAIEIKYCQSCLEKGRETAAVREWQTGIYLCKDCFQEKLQSITSIPNVEQKVIEATSLNVQEKTTTTPKLPILDFIYEHYQIPKELQFDSMDTVCRNHDKIFNFHAPAVVNRTIESLAEEIEALAMSLFYIKYRIEPLTNGINRLKEQRRVEKGLKNYDDSKENYAKDKKPKVKETEMTKAANKLGMTKEEMEALVKKAKEREFNKMAGNCPECGGPMPCPKEECKGK